ncbi:PREDICTED: putative UDP-glucose flavonoid 3-O-glucosyltransferase 3 [Prunus mume]|uniref:Glycosyltransferase n=1 Tax=Prunus mume TaxID=102107 RepID=A0ABM0NTL4_PRUMU|nr:PREDICTED: putative UDP-glucose flavonoid 3-O-glucosyltransferase 3 [Prunus mume]
MNFSFPSEYLKHLPLFLPQMEKASELVFIPSAGMGHLVSAVEMARLLVARHDRLFITVFIMKLPFDSKGTESYIASLEASPVSPRVNFITLPKVPTIDKHMSPNSFRNQFIESHKTHVKNAVAELTESESDSRPRLAGFIIDMFCTTMIDVADEFGVPTYMFFTSPAAFLGLLFSLQRIRDVYNKDVSDFKDSDAELALPTFVNSVPAKVLPSVLLDKDGAEALLGYAKRFRETKGILVNTFMELESHALDSLSNGETPPLYPVGPILNLKSDDSQSGSEQAQQKSDVLEWLDDQPPSSVVFLCFGSMGSFGEDQVREIAWGLERSGLRFLWSLRQPPPKETVASPSDYSDPKAVLPEGFLDRAVGIGKVIGWAPQVAILAHPAIGGFVSHCGWNSTLESLWFGVPVATWPMYAEQQLNAFELVRELGLAVEINMEYRRSFYGDSPKVVKAEEIERGIREVMVQDSDLRKRVKETSEKSKAALMDGGSSHSSLGHFLDQIFL